MNTIDDAMKQKWYKLCLKFYTEPEDKISKAEIERFENLDVSIRESEYTAEFYTTANNNPANNVVDSEFNNFFHCIRNDLELYYEMNKLKNKARSDSHQQLARIRIDTLHKRVDDINTSLISNGSVVDVAQSSSHLKTYFRYFILFSYIDIMSHC